MQKISTLILLALFSRAWSQDLALGKIDDKECEMFAVRMVGSLPAGKTMKRDDFFLRLNFPLAKGRKISEVQINGIKIVSYQLSDRYIVRWKIFAEDSDAANSEIYAVELVKDSLIVAKSWEGVDMKTEIP